MFSTRSGFSLFFYKAMLPRTLISIDATPCIASASHAHALGPLQGPTYPLLGHTPSTLVNTNSDRDAHRCLSICSTSYSALPSTYIGFGKRRWLWYLFSNATLNTGCTFIPCGSSSLAALHPTICNTLNGPTYWGQSFPGLSFNFRCFVDSSTLSSGPMSVFLWTLSACCLFASAYFVSCPWTSVHILHKLDK